MKRHPRQSILTLAATAFAILGFTATSASAQVIIDDTLPVLIGVGNQGTTGLAIVASYDASASDKLVVVVSTEHAFGINAGMSINSVEYNGQAMIEAVQENTLPGTAAIYYLDSPGPAGEIRIFQGNQNGGLATVYALSSVAPGLGGFGQSITNSVDVTTTSPNELVIACILDGGQAANGNNAGAPTAVLPLIQDHSGTWGNSWAGHGAGHQFIASPGIVTSTFTTAGPNLLRTVAVAFHECMGCATREQYGAGCNSISYASFYELSDTASFDLTDTDIMATNTGAGYVVLPTPGTGPLAVGLVDPLGGTVLTLPDDGQVVAGTLGMSVGSNGWMALGGGNSNGFAPTGATMLGNPSEAVYTWTDLQPNNSGTVTYEEDVATGQCRVTFDGVNGWNTPDPCFIQIDMNVNTGDWAIRYGVVGFANPEQWLVGYSPAGANADPGGTDISAAGVIITYGTDILPLTLEGIGRPIQGPVAVDYEVTTTNIEAGSLIHVGIVGLNRPGTPLAAVGFGSGDCFLNASLDIVVGVVILPGATETWTGLTLPANNPINNGFVFNLQAATLDANVLSAAGRTSNGLKCTVGDV
jgi:hypothetical protein